ncbi:MAG: GNAT family N-acetyltransferase [Actinomycetota bacterium]|nr:GNAT family N-acetyltransferase [Actinomycetota bacterium]
MGSPNVRLASLADIERIAEIHVAAWRAAYTGLVDEAALADRTIEKRMRQWKEVIEGDGWPDHEVHVIERDGHIQGFAQTSPSDDEDAHLERTLHVNALYLDPVRRGSGLGAVLLDYVLAKAELAGYTLATLYVLIDNDGARRFYERNGWEPEPDVVSECLGDGTVAPQLRYRKKLRQPSSSVNPAAP